MMQIPSPLTEWAQRTGPSLRDWNPFFAVFPSAEAAGLSWFAPSGAGFLIQQPVRSQKLVAKN
jgi:hypothetical protein